MERQGIKLFVDFDGTVTPVDVGSLIFDTFLRPELLAQGWHEKILTEWRAGRLSSAECLSRECENTIITRARLNSALDTIPLTEGFIETVDYCKIQGIELVVLSDGLDYYIQYILAHNGITDIAFRSNRMFFNNGSLKVEFPYMEKGCGRCGNCKRWHMESVRKDGTLVVYAGDGYSDVFAVRSADVIFAKDDLADFCQKHGIPYRPFVTFFDIIAFLKDRDEIL